MWELKKYVENFSASSVADVTISFSSGRIRQAFFSSPKRTSSWNKTSFQEHAIVTASEVAQSN
eukprot:417579-Amphidinium_carterae.3